mmetsp:Transcript_4995/g.14661  ORF Transcript_4995/g.14661 Transcript_4995/m.14661 type:complete len:262 (+) Transcript_4995:215-1000(+)
MARTRSFSCGVAGELRPATVLRAGDATLSTQLRGGRGGVAKGLGPEAASGRGGRTSGRTFASTGAPRSHKLTRSAVLRCSPSAPPAVGRGTLLRVGAPRATPGFARAGYPAALDPLAEEGEGNKSRLAVDDRGGASPTEDPPADRAGEAPERSHAREHDSDEGEAKPGEAWPLESPRSSARPGIVATCGETRPPSPAHSAECLCRPATWPPAPAARASSAARRRASRGSPGGSSSPLDAAILSSDPLSSRARGEDGNPSRA